MSDPVSALFEQELTRPGVWFRLDDGSHRYRIEHHGGELLVSLDNLARAYNRDRDESRITFFVDTVLGNRFENRPWPEAQPTILFALEPSDHAEPSDLRTPLSKQVDRVPVVYVADPSRGTITWITQAMLDDWNISLAELETTASRNLAAALAAAKVAYKDIDGVRLGISETDLAFKTALILAPNLQEVVSPTLGWPLLAVIPDRNFLYLWAVQHRDFMHRVGEVVIREFTSSPYPLTTEVFEIGDVGIVAIGAFPVVET
jgi:hypothetical protein